MHVRLRRNPQFRRRPDAGLIFNCDRGSQYASGDFQKQLKAFEMRGSIYSLKIWSKKGDCWDNAVTEAMFGSLKVERLHGVRFVTRRLAKDEVIDWLRFYNHRRMHSTLGYLARWLSRRKCKSLSKNLANLKNLPHDPSAKRNAKRGQGHFIGNPRIISVGTIQQQSATEENKKEQYMFSLNICRICISLGLGPTIAPTICEVSTVWYMLQISGKISGKRAAAYWA